MSSEAKRLAKWTGRYDVIQGSRLDFDGGAFFWQYQLILSLGIPNPIAKWDLGPEGYRAMNQLCFEGGLFSRRVVDKIGLPMRASSSMATMPATAMLPASTSPPP